MRRLGIYVALFLAGAITAYSAVATFTDNAWFAVPFLLGVLVCWAVWAALDHDRRSRR